MREKALNRSPMSLKTRLKCIAHTRPVLLYNLNGTIYGKYPTIILFFFIFMATQA